MPDKENNCCSHVTEQDTIELGRFPSAWIPWERTENFSMEHVEGVYGTHAFQGNVNTQYMYIYFPASKLVLLNLYLTKDFHIVMCMYL